MSKENVYDEKICPLMAQIISICEEAKIPLIAQFALDGDMRCSTYPCPEDHTDDSARAAFRRARSALRMP